jgi:phage-related protein
MLMKIMYYLTPAGRNPVNEFALSLPKEDQGRLVEVYLGIQEHGLDYERVAFRQLEGKLWEIKYSAKGGGYRIAYVLIEKDSMVWLHAFKKKSQKTPKADLELAKRRAKEVLEG